MHHTFCFPIHPNASDEEPRLLDVLEELRLFFNSAHQERIDSWRILRKSVSLYDQLKSLTEIRANDPELAATSVTIQRSALKRVDHAWKGFFRRVKDGETPGRPRYKKHGRYKSFSFPFAKCTIAGEGRSARLHIPNFGDIRINLYRPLKGRPLEVTVRHDSTGQWYAAISCDLGAAPEPIDPATITEQDILGADVGITSLVAFSDGSILPNPRHFERGAAQLKSRQQSVARKRKGSNSRRRAQKLVAKAYKHGGNQRRDYFRKAACDVVAHCKAIAFEDLNIAGLAKGRLGKQVNDAAWRLYRQIVSCKAEEAGKLIVLVDARRTSQECSGCGAIVKKELHERWHHCEVCGTSLDRDVNASCVIKARGITALGMSVAQARAAPAPKPNRRSKVNRGGSAATQL